MVTWDLMRYLLTGVNKNSSCQLQDCFILFSHLFLTLVLSTFFSIPFTSSSCSHLLPCPMPLISRTDFTKCILYMILKRSIKEKSVYLSEMTYLETVKSRVSKRYQILPLCSPTLQRGIGSCYDTEACFFHQQK